MGEEKRIVSPELKFGKKNLVTFSVFGDDV